jgi:hypothetical protein
MPGAEANWRPAAWVNESRAVALRHVLESARHPAKAGTKARGRQIAEGWRFADWLADGSTFCSGGRQDIAVNIAVGRGATMPRRSANENHASARSSWKPTQ